MRRHVPLLALFTSITSVSAAAQAALPKADDFDGDGKADLAVFEPRDGTWHIRRSGDGATLVQAWGWNEVTPVPGDYDGDGETDIAVYHQPSGTWYILQSQSGSLRQVSWGWWDAMAVPGDYDGDGKTDIAVYHQATGDWYILQSATGTQRIQAWGWYDAVPAPADYDGDQKTDITVYHPAAGKWYILQSSNNTQRQVSWGWSEAVPVPANYDGDTKADIAVYHQAASKWYILPSGGGPGQEQVWGSGQPVAAPGDHDGDGKADITVYHRRTGQWSVLTSGPSASWYPVHGNREQMSVGLSYQVFRQKLARLPKRVVVFGDSVAAGAGATGVAAFTGCTNSGSTQPAPNRAWSYQLTQNEDAVWPERAGQDLRTKAFSSIPGNCVTYHNFAVGGATTSTVITQQLSASSPAKQQFPTPPDGTTLAVLDIGGNDLLVAQGPGATWYSPAVAAATANLSTIATKIRQIFGPATRIHVAGVYDPADGWSLPPALIPFDPVGVKGSYSGWWPIRAADEVFAPGVPFSGASVALNNSYSASAGQIGVSFVDIRAPFLGHGHFWNNAQQSGAGWFWDQVHPNDAGHSALRDAFWASIDLAFPTL